MCASLCAFSGPLKPHIDAHISHLATVVAMRFTGLTESFDVAVVGGGPAGLMAAEAAADAGAKVVVIEAGRTPGRKFLLAGRSGLNLTHHQPIDRFLAQYGPDQPLLRPMVEAFDPDALRQWSASLGEPCSVGTSGRIFPASWRAAPLLRAWLKRLDERGVAFRTSTRWNGFVDGGPSITVKPHAPGAPGQSSETNGDRRDVAADDDTHDVDADEVIRTRATVLACGGASWPRTGSDGAWVHPLSAQGVLVRPWGPSNAGLRLNWSPYLQRFVGEPIKGVALSSVDGRAVRGDLVVVAGGLQGTPAYTVSGAAARSFSATGTVTLNLDLRPDDSADRLAQRLAARKPGESLSNVLRRLAKLSPAAIALANEFARPPHETAALAAYLKALPLPVVGTESIERAISSSGGVAWNALDGRLGVRGLYHVFAAGEMIAWDAPTGGYLLQACFSTGAWAGTHAAEAALAKETTKPR